MQKPQESLDDFLRSIEPKEMTPPSVVPLRPTGEIQVLKPLELESAPTQNALLLRHGAPRISWFHRSLIFGGGSVAAVTLIFLSAVLIGINDQADRAAVDDMDIPSGPSNIEMVDARGTDEPSELNNIFVSDAEAIVSGELGTVQSADRSIRVRHRVRRAPHVRPHRVPAIKKVVDFVPTTLVIYAENGEIKSLIEPNLTAGYKIPVSFSN